MPNQPPVSTCVRSVFLSVVSTFAVAAGVSAQHYSDWDSPENLGGIVDSAFNDQHPAVSPDGLSLHFVSDRHCGTGALDLWVTQRDSLEGPWQPPAGMGTLRIRTRIVTSCTPTCRTRTAATRMLPMPTRPTLTRAITAIPRIRMSGHGFRSGSDEPAHGGSGAECSRQRSVG
jgi:hypothetical protein